MKIIYNFFIFFIYYIFSYFHSFGYFGFEKVNDGIVNKTGNITISITNTLMYLLGFIGLIAVVFVIYGGFRILTAGGDDENVKKGKKIVLYSLLGIFIISIAGSIVMGIYGGLDKNT